MQREPFKRIEELAQGQLVNFKKTARVFPDVLQWAERVKEFISISNLSDQGPDSLRAYIHLLYLANKSFLHSLIIEMELHHFHASAVERIGIDAVKQMAIIEINFEEHLKIWTNYQWYRGDPSRGKQIKSEYDRVFNKLQSKHDYSKFMSTDVRDEIQQRWEDCSQSGSHASFESMILGVSYPRPETDVFNFFDNVESDITLVGVQMGVLIDTFFMLSRVVAGIFEQHDLQLRYSSDKLGTIWNEWIDFKMQKAKEWHIDDHRSAASANPK